MAVKPVSIQLNVNAKGAEAVGELVAKLKELGGTRIRVEDPTRSVASGAAQSASAVNRLKGELGGLRGGTPLADPTANLRAGTQRSSEAVTQLRNELGRLFSIAAVGAGFKTVAGSAIQFESAMADVRKVVDGTEPQMTALAESIVKMGREIPIATVGLADIAAAAGQMGVAIEDIPAFTELTAKAATAFGMLPREAGDAFASLSAIFRIPLTELEGLADTINVLGNTTASNERSIIDVLTRVGSTGTAIGFTREQLAAMAASALPLVSGQANRAATGLDSLFTRLATIQGATDRARYGFESLGMSTADFAQDFKKDAVGALTDFFERLKQFDKQDQVNIVNDIFGEGPTAEILAIAAAFSDVERNIAAVSDKTKTAGAVQAEYNGRAGTTENSLTLLKNTLNEVSTNIGDAFLPAIREFSASAKEVSLRIAEWVKENPELVKTIGTVVGALLGLKVATLAISLLFGSFPGVISGIVGGLGMLSSKSVAAGVGVGALTNTTRGLLRMFAGFALSPAGGILAALAAVAGAAVYARRKILDMRSEANRAEGVTLPNTPKEVFDFKSMDEANKVLAEAKAAQRKAEDALEAAVGPEAKRQALNAYLLSNRHIQAVQEAYDRAKADLLATAGEAGSTGGGVDAPPPAVTNPFAGWMSYVPFALRDKGDEGPKTKPARAFDAIIQAEIEAERRRLRSARDVLNAELDAMLDGRLLSQREYIAKKEALDLQAVENERQSLLKTRANVEKALGVPELKDDERDRLLAELRKLDADIDATLDSEKVIKIRAEIDQERLRQEIAEMRADLSQDIAELSGRSLEAALMGINAERERLLNDPRFKDDAETRALIEQRATLQINQATFDEKKRLADETNAYLQIAEADLQSAFERGQMSFLERERASNALRQEAAEKIREQADAMRELAAENPELQLQVAQLDAQYRRLVETTDTVAKTINEAFATSAVEGLETLITRAESAEDVLLGIANSVAQAWKKLAAEELNSVILKSIGGQSGGLGGVISGFMSNIFGGFRAGGGGVDGNKFYVVGEKGPEIFAPGVSGTIATNAALNSAMRDVAGRPGAAPNVGGGGGFGAPVFSPNIRIINENDPQRARDAMADAEGATVIRNQLGGMRNYLRQLVGAN